MRRHLFIQDELAGMTERGVTEMVRQSDRFGFCFYCYHDHRDLHSFPTRRSSDLVRIRAGRTEAAAAVALYGLYEVIRGFGGDDLEAARRHTADIVALERSLGIFCEQGVQAASRSEEHTSELQSRRDLVCRLLLEK